MLVLVATITTIIDVEGHVLRFLLNLIIIDVMIVLLLLIFLVFDIVFGISVSFTVFVVQIS